MPYILVRHKVADYTKWKPVFDAHATSRQASGVQGGYLFRSTDDPNELFLLLEVTNLEQARQFAQSEDLRQAMQRGGVVDQPDIYFLEELERPPVRYYRH